MQISASGDSYLNPSLLGGSPGGAGTDPDILADNNKAQRNLQTTIGTGGAGGEYYAIVHNNERSARDINLAYSLDPTTAKYVSGGMVGVVGGENRNLIRPGRLVLRHMMPGEDRWIRVQFGRVTAPDGALVAVRVTELGSRGPVNGFAIGYIREPLSAVVRDQIRVDADVLGRLASIEASADLERTRRMLVSSTTEGGEPDIFRNLMISQMPYLRKYSDRAFTGASGDSFGLRGALAGVDRALTVKNNEALLIAANQTLQRLDAQLTMTRRRSASR